MLEPNILINKDKTFASDLIAIRELVLLINQFSKCNTN